MTKHLFFCLAGVFAATACQAVDFTPRFVSRGSEQIPYYVEGSTKYTLFVPADTLVTAEGSGTAFYFRQLEGASLVIKPSPQAPSLVFSGPGKAIYAQAARQTLPEGAEEAVLQEGKSAGLSMADGESQEFLYGFKLPGRRFMQAISFVNYSATQQIAIILTATEGSFDKALATSQRILRSWRKVHPGEDLSATPSS